MGNCALRRVRSFYFFLSLYIRTNVRSCFYLDRNVHVVVSKVVKAYQSHNYVVLLLMIPMHHRFNISYNLHEYFGKH